MISGPSRTVDLVLPLRLSAGDVHRLLASIMVPGQIFRDREELELHLTQSIILGIAHREPTPDQVRLAREAIEQHMSELRR